MTSRNMMQMKIGAEIPSKYEAACVEEKWRHKWEDAGIYRWDPQRPRDETFVVDSPPPTVSGSLHIGHTFSYTQTDLLVRYARMRGKNIMYPMGWDDNGLPTERRVQNRFGISCDARLPYDSNLVISDLRSEGGQGAVKVSRQNFIEACAITTQEDERAFMELWRHLGLSVEWQQEYATVGTHCRQISQLSFLDLVEKGYVYQATAPTIWDVTFQSAVAQAELEDREVRGHFHDIRFGVRGGSSFVIATTRPELLGACIAVVAHPSDQRYQHLFGKYAVTPVFGVPVPILASEHADPEKGSGIMMVCTFGDVADVSWWKASGLPARLLIGRDGRMLPVTFGSAEFPSLAAEAANHAYSQLAGKTLNQARRQMVELLRVPEAAFDDQGAPLMGDPRPITHSVKYYEKGEQPVEFVASRQWYIRIVDYKEQFLEQGRKIQWYPDHMRHRYEHWVEGLSHDWCISRQRFFGVPFPVWYPLDNQANPDFSRPIFARKENLPVDPLSQCPPWYEASQRDAPNGFCGEPDVMDTWATSSMTPQIVSHWGLPSSRHQKLFPMDLRPQAHEIIRTWAFYTIVKAWMHEREIPWKQVAVSGWILDPDRKKMSKSKGNAVTPRHYLDQYSADAVRYWAARARLGVDTALDPKVFDMGRKVSTKLFNASRFVLGQLKELGQEARVPGMDEVKAPLDIAWIAKLRKVVNAATASFEGLDYAGALSSVEGAFWEFCDNYLELVKVRAYQGAEADKRSALAALAGSLNVLLRLFAPFMPYVTEEMWQHLRVSDAFSSIHTASWPHESELPLSAGANEAGFDAAVKITGEIRKAKSRAGKSMGTPLAKLEVRAAVNSLLTISGIIDDVANAARVVPGGIVLTGLSEDQAAVADIAVLAEVAS